MPYSKKCPYCGEALSVDEAAQAVRCGACKSAFMPDELRVQSEEEILRLLKDRSEEKTDCSGFACDNCGVQLIAEETAAVPFCCCCGSPAVLPTLVSDAVKPELVLPFAVDRREAQDRFLHWFGKKKLISPVFSEAVRTGRINGVYVPFWLFDCAMETHLHAASATTETVRTEKSENVTARDFFHYRAVKTAFTDVPADASDRMDERLMELLGPFDLSRLERCTPLHMEGFFAEKNGLSAQQAFARVRERLEADALRAAQETLGTERYARVCSCSHLYKSLSARFALLPVWIVTCRDHGFTHQFFMNGQTGKIVGEAPQSLSRSLQWFVGVTAAVAAAGELVWLAMNKLF